MARMKTICATMNSQTTEWWISGSSIFWNFVLPAYVPHKIQATAPAPWLPWPRKSRNPMGTRCPTNGGHRPTRPTPRPSFGPHDPAAPTSARWRLDPPKIYLHLSTWYVYIIFLIFQLSLSVDLSYKYKCRYSYREREMGWVIHQISIN